MPSDPRRAPRAGDVLDGRYRLVDRLGHGGFGDVWRAEELLPDGAPFRDVALKLLIPGGADTLDWAEEAKLLASFRHPSLVTIYAAGILATDPPRRFVAMELLLGQNLADVHRARGRIPWRRVLGWAVSAAAALDIIHAAGVVHLDLKPANLFLCEGGALKVLDFGIARRAGVASVMPRRGERLPPAVSPREAEVATGLFIAERAASSHSAEAFAATRPVVGTDPTIVDPRPAVSSPRVVVGTPGFMAPEILDLAEPTAAADAYALAVCVVLLVSGHLPVAAPEEPPTWDDPTAVSAWLDAIRRATLRGELRPFDAGSMGLPRGVAALLRRLLSVDPAARNVVPGKLGALFDEVWERPHGVPDPPYFGLAPFPAEGEGLLFGRDDDIARLGRELEIEPAIVLQGPAGAGKSSLLAAGVLPYLGRASVDGKDDWTPLRIAAGAEPDAALAAALSEVSPELAEAGVAELSAWCERSPVGVAIVLDPIDAFASAPGRARLDALVGAIAAGPAPPGLRVLGAVREESAPAFLDLPMGRALRGALRFLGAPATAAVKDIVAAPAHFAGVTVYGADRAVADVQRELRAGGVRLPYVALALADLWPALATGAKDAVERWASAGGVRGAVVRHAERVHAALSEADRAVAIEILLRLSTTDARPLRWDRAELVSAIPDADADRVLDHLAREHLVLLTRGNVEIGHEALLGGFQTLASARLSEMDRLAFFERVREARVAWERAENHRDLLLHGALLGEVRARDAWVREGLTPADRAFVQESRRRERVRRAFRWATVALVGLFACGAVWGKEMLDDAREAEARARAAKAELEHLAELSARARRTEDPYQRVAFAAAAMERGSPDGLLPLEIASAAGNVARASFLALDHVAAPAFPWDDRYLVGLAAGGTLALFDFRGAEPEVIEDVDLDFDPAEAEALHFRMPASRRLRPHDAPVVERVPFAFDTALATRAADGEVKVFRIRDDGAPVLAAVAPMRCAGSVVVAASAPVLACGVEGGVARWDMRQGGALAQNPFPGNVVDVSADGARVAAANEKEVLLWEPGGGREVRHATPRPVTAVRFGPRDPVAALADGRDLVVLSLAASEPQKAVLFTTTVSVVPDQVRWDEGGLDVAVCGAGVGRWVYLKHGGRLGADPPPRGEPCATTRARARPEGRDAPVDITRARPEGRDAPVDITRARPEGRDAPVDITRARPEGRDAPVDITRARPEGRDAPVDITRARPEGRDAPVDITRARPEGRDAPEPLRSADDYPELADRDVGAHPLSGGFRLRKRRFLSRDLVVFDGGPTPAVTSADGKVAPVPAAAARLLRFEGRDATGGEERRDDRDSIAAVEHDDVAVMVQVRDRIRFYARADGTRLGARPGYFLRRCADGRWLSWLAAGDRYALFDAWTTARIADVRREPGLVLGADSACANLYTQRLDGTLLAIPIHGGPPRMLGRADGYAYLVRPSARPGGGLLIAFGSGAIARIDDATSAVQILAYASPRATAIADGPRAGEVLFADATGVVVARADAPPTWLLDGSGGAEWADLSAAPDGGTILLADGKHLSVLDVARRELSGSMPLEGRDRLTPWDDEGSVLAWSFTRAGPVEGVVIPRGVSLARAVSAAISNLAVEKGRIVIRR